MTTETQLQELLKRKAHEMSMDSHMPETVKRGALRRQTLYVGIAAAVVPALIAAAVWMSGSNTEPEARPIPPAEQPGTDTRWLESLPSGRESSRVGEFKALEEGNPAQGPGRYVYSGISPDIVFRMMPDTGPGSRASFVGLILPSGGFLRMTNMTGTLSHETEFPAAEPLPDDIAAYLQDHPLVETTDPEPMTVGGYEGFQIDITAQSFPHTCQAAPEGGGSTECLKLLHNEVWPLIVSPGEATRVVLVEVERRLIGFTFPIGGKSEQEARRTLESVQFLEPDLTD